MHDVSNAINQLDKAIDAKICGKGTNGWSNSGSEESDKCYAGKSGQASSLTNGFSDMFSSNTTHSSYTENKEQKMDELPKTTAKISKDMSNLTRDQKGVVSSAFARAHEGAEIVEIRSISTTSVMVLQWLCVDISSKT